MLYEPGSFGGNGRGLARGRCCTRAEALGRMVGNTFHGHGRFGTYMLGDYFPKRTDQSVDANGLVTDRQTCSGFTADGASNGVPLPHAAAADSAAHERVRVQPTAWRTASRRMSHVAGLSVAFSDNVDYDNAFVGQYDLGDVQYLKHVYVRALPA